MIAAVPKSARGSQETDQGYDEVSSHPSHLRRGEITREELLSLADDLQAAVTRIRGHVLTMDKYGMSAVYMDGVTKLSRGTDEIQKFLPYLERGMLDSQ